MWRAKILLYDTLRTLRHSGAVYYYAWLSVATAVHHLVVTYWQAAIPRLESHHSPPPPAPSAALEALRSMATDALHSVPPLMLTAPLHTSAPSLLAVGDSPAWHAAPSVALLAPLDYGNSSSCVHPPGESVNGYAQAVASLLGGCAALLPMLGEHCLRTGGTYARLRDLLILTGPLALAALLYLMSVVESEAPYMASYVLFHVGFELLRVICEAEGARCIANYKAAGAPRFAAVSGLTTTLSLTLQVLLQIGFNHPHQLDLQIQFQILAAILVGVFVGYACLTLRRCALSWDGADDGDADRSVAASPQMMEPQTSYRCFDDARTSATVSSASRAGS